MSNITATSRTLDDWYLTINKIYLDRNFYRDPFSIFAHLVEILGGLSLLASGKQKTDVTPETFVPKALAWWMALCGKMGIRSVEMMVWQKFPGVCSYCLVKPHENDKCVERKAEVGLDWTELGRIGDLNEERKPKSLAEWQRMFADIYPVTATEDYPATVSRFTEELGELAEALRVSPIAPGYFLSEAADVFAWLMHLQNLIHSKRQIPTAERGNALSQWFASAYPDRCIDCSNPVCSCPPILPGTLGRIAHEIPANANLFARGGALLSQEEAARVFDLGARTLRVGDKELEITVPLIKDIHSVVQDLQLLAVSNTEIAHVQSLDLTIAINGIKELVEAQRVTQDSVDALARAISQLPTEGRNAVISFLTGLGSSAWAGTLIEAVKLVGG